MSKVLLNLPRDEQLRICDEYFFEWSKIFLDYSLVIYDLTIQEGVGVMGAGVEILKESVIRVQSQLNDWMNCVFVVNKNDEEKARDVLERAWDSFWEDGDGWCYGNYLEDKLINAGVVFDVYYADAEE